MRCNIYYKIVWYTHKTYLKSNSIATLKINELQDHDKGTIARTVIISSQ